MRTLLLTAATLFSLGLTGVTAHAETVTLPVGTGHQTHWPQRGDSTQSVRHKHGAPLQQHAAIGTPPITRWNYAGFAVYFEQDVVIHSVAIRRVAIPSTSAAPRGAMHSSERTTEPLTRAADNHD